MPTYCSIVNCSNTSDKSKDLRFFDIPKIRKNEGKEAEELSKKRFAGWLKAINRKGFTEKEIKGKRWIKVCSEHFISGSPAYRHDFSNPDWVPNLHLGYEQSTQNTGLFDRRKQRKQKQVEASTEQCMEPTEVLVNILQDEKACPETHPETENSPEVKNSHVIQTEMTMSYINTLEAEVYALSADLIAAKAKLEQCIFDEKYFEINSDKVKSYTGLAEFGFLKDLYWYLEPYITHTSRNRLSKFQELLLVLFKLKLSLSFQVLGDMFFIHKSTASAIFLKNLDIMYHRLKDLIYWPETEEVRETMPREFIKEYGRKVTVIIDCFEVFIERPSGVLAQSKTFSSYKHHNTVKYLLGITPQGSVSFLSSGYGGRYSDKHITEDSGFLDKLRYGDLVLADRGFDIATSVNTKFAVILLPAFTKGRKQLSALEIEGTRKLAHLRINVERVLGNVQQKYKILQDTMPIDFLLSKPNEIPTLDKIVTLCFSLVNYCPSVVPLD